MPRLVLDFCIASILLLGGIFMVVSKDTIVVDSLETATTTPPAAGSVDIPTFLPIVFSDALEVVEAEIEEVAETVKESAKEPAKILPQEEKVEPREVAPVVAAPVTIEPTTSIDSAAITLRGALVNIVCYTPAGSRVHSISGSGVLVDPKGIILTNAHIAQYLLLYEQGVSCTVRTGAPAIDSYTAALIFISGKWIEENADLLVTSLPAGTGEHDFALLAVTKSASTVGNPLPSQFPFIPLANEPSIPGTPVVIGGYGAQFLGVEQIQFMLFPTLAFGSVKDIFTFGTNTVDVLALGGSAVAQQGSSGGGVADANGELVGTIVTSTQEQITSDRSLDAITASYIRNAYATETGEPLDLLLARPLIESVIKFLPKKAELEAVLLKALQ